jgi:hypothetical protein
VLLSAEDHGREPSRLAVTERPKAIVAYRRAANASGGRRSASPDILRPLRIEEGTVSTALLSR